MLTLSSLGTGAGYLKGGFLGFAGSGKTYTAVEIATGLRKHLSLTGPIAMLDTEAAAQYVAPKVRKETGLDLLGHQSRALGDAVEFLKVCISQKVSVAIIDSVTHLWREVCDSYLKQFNEAAMKQNKRARTRLEFQDWGPIKAKWGTFSDLYLNSPLHVIICGRAGYEYDYEDREDGSGKDLIKTGVKMKTEGEFGFEPSLLVQMERVMVDGDGKITPNITHRATIIKDRFGVLDGRSADNPTYDFFKPFVDHLTPGSSVTVDTTKQTDLEIDPSGDAAIYAERRARTIACEEIEGLLTVTYPSQGAADKSAKLEIVNRVFGTRSWAAVQAMSSESLKGGLAVLPDAIKKYAEDTKKAEPSKEKEKVK